MSDTIPTAPICPWIPWILWLRFLPVDLGPPLRGSECAETQGPQFPSGEPPESHGERWETTLFPLDFGDWDGTTGSLCKRRLHWEKSSIDRWIFDRTGTMYVLFPTNWLTDRELTPYNDQYEDRQHTELSLLFSVTRIVLIGSTERWQDQHGCPGEKPWWRGCHILQSDVCAIQNGFVSE